MGKPKLVYTSLCNDEVVEHKLLSQAASSSRQDQQHQDSSLVVECGEENAMTGILADDTLLHVLRFNSTRSLLSSAALVCRRWRRLCCSHLVFELVPSPLSPYDRPWGTLKEQDIMDLARCHASTVEKLHLHGLKRLKSDQVISLIVSLPRIKELAIISCPLLVSSDLEGIANSLPSRLTVLDLHIDYSLTFDCYDCTDAPPPLIHDEFLELLPKKCPKLQKLNLDSCSHITMRGLDTLIMAIPNLCSLNLHSHVIGWLEVSKIFGCCTSLQHLSLVSPLFVQDSSSSDEEDGVALLRGRGKGNLRGRSQNPFPPGSEALNLMSVPPSLQSIRLYSNPHQSVPLDSPPMSSLLKQRGQQLRHLHAQSLFNTSWHTISVWCANLQTVDLSHARDKLREVTGIEEVVLCGLPRLLKGLERIGLPTATDRILVELGRFCPKLKEVHFEGYGGEIIRRQSSVTDRGVVALSEGCSGLEVLSLAGCNKVTTTSMRCLAFHCRNLKALHLTGCQSLKNDSVTTLLPRLGNSLLFLDLVGCSKITSVAVQNILQHVQTQGTSLRVLAISRTLWRSSKTELLELTKNSPFLSIRTGASGVSWHGFYHSSFSQLTTSHSNDF